MMSAVFKLLWFVVLGALVADRIRDTFPAIDATGWGVLVAAWVLLVVAALRLSTVLVRLRPGALSEDRAEVLAIIVVSLLAALLVMLAWRFIGPHVAPHFGPLQTSILRSTLARGAMPLA